MILYALPVFWVLRHEFNEHKDKLEVVVFSLKQKQKTKVIGFLSLYLTSLVNLVTNNQS